LIESLQTNIAALEAAVADASSVEGVFEEAAAYRDIVIPAMAAVRADADALEVIVDSDIWPLPSYAQMLFIR
jgi:glutamine synthetase